MNFRCLHKVALVSVGLISCAQYSAQESYLALLFLNSDSGGGGNGPGMYANVSGLSGTLVLQNGGANDWTITSDGTFLYPGSIASSDAYAFTIYSRPSNQTCTISGGDNGDGSGTYSGDTETVTVSCSTNGAAVLSGIQTGTTTMNPALRNIAVTAVNMSRSFVICYFQTDSSDPSQVPTCQLTATNQVQIQTGGANAANTVRYYLAEFSSGVSVQRGNLQLTAGNLSGTATLGTPVNTARSFIWVTSRTTDNTRTADERRTVTARFSNSSTIQFDRNESGTVVDIEWQAIEISSGTVQSGISSMANGQASLVVTLPTQFNTSRTALIMNYRGGTTVNGIEGDFYVQGALSGTNTLTFTRIASNGTVDIAWFVVELTDGASVQSGTATTLPAPNSETNIDVTLSPAVDLTRTIPFVYGTVFNDSDSDQDSGSFTPTLTSTTNLRLIRGSNQDRRADAAWYTIQLAP